MLRIIDFLNERKVRAFPVLVPHFMGKKTKIQDVKGFTWGYTATYWQKEKSIIGLLALSKTLHGVDQRISSDNLSVTTF